MEANVISFNVLLSVGTSWRCSQLCLEEMLSRWEGEGMVHLVEFFGSRHKHVQTLNSLFSFKFIYYIVDIVWAAHVSNIGWILVQMMIAWNYLSQIIVWCLMWPWIWCLCVQNRPKQKRRVCSRTVLLVLLKRFMPSCWQILNQIGFIPKPLGFYIQVFETSFHFLSRQYMT